MKIFPPLLASLILPLFLSCSSEKINSVSDMQGTWVSGKEMYREYNRKVYYQFDFQNDSFFMELGVVSDDTHTSYEPFKAKGIFVVTDDYLLFTGIAKREGSTDFNLNYKERFYYVYGMDYNSILSLHSIEKLNLTRYDLIRKYQSK